MNREDKINLLLVDDRPDGLMALEAVLASPELNLIKAASGEEALLRLEDDDFAAILMDVQLPVLDGFETATIIRRSERLKQIPIIFITAINMERKHVFQGYECGAVDYLFKPFDPFILKSKVAIFIELHRKNVEVRKQAALLAKQTEELQKVNDALQREMAERLRAEKEMVAISNREQVKFGRDLHDGLSQQLAAIGFMIRGIQQGLPSEYETEIGRLSEQIRKAIADTNSLAKGLNPVALETNGLVSALKTLSVNAAKLFNVECTFECDPALEVNDLGACTHLYRMAQESIHNAVRHGKAKRIRINLDADLPGKARMTIHDDGVGFPTNGGDPDGMGLRNMKHRAKLLGATFRIASKPDGGTTVECIFDQSATDAKSPSDPSNDPFVPPMNLETPKNGDCKRVMIIEDHPVVRRWVKELVNREKDLKICGEADTASEGLSLIPGLKPHVILVDVNLKDSHGVELVRKITTQFQGPKVLVVSMYDEHSWAEQALLAGAKGYAAKEEPENIVNAIRQILDGHLYVSGKHGQAILEKVERGLAKQPVAIG